MHVNCSCDASTHFCSMLYGLRRFRIGSSTQPPQARTQRQGRRRCCRSIRDRSDQISGSSSSHRTSRMSRSLSCWMCLSETLPSRSVTRVDTSVFSLVEGRMRRSRIRQGPQRVNRLNLHLSSNLFLNLCSRSHFSASEPRTCTRKLDFDGLICNRAFFNPRKIASISSPADTTYTIHLPTV